MSKVTRPVLTGVFPRKRLLSLLDRMRRRPVIWVAGPAGSGKTTLISSYIELRKIPCLWYQIDEGDSDPSTFFYYLGQAAKRASPRFRKLLPLLTPEYLQDVPTFTYRYFENLSNRLKIPSALIFDNYQDIPLESPLHEVISNGLSRIPEGMNVIFISRIEPPSAFIRLRANNLMSHLGWEELRLNPEESRAIIKSKTRQKLSKETIQHLHKTADGWAAGLVLILEGLKRGIKPQELQKLAPEEIFDYFGKELFDKTDNQTQDFFLKTAFLPKMTAKMAEALTELPSADRILSSLSRNNYFTEKRLLTEPIYQYHPLFREFLISRAKETFSRETLSVLFHRAALLLEEAGQTKAAISLLREATDWDTIIHLILKHAPLMINQGRYPPLEEWLEKIPEDTIENNPWLLYWMGACRFPFDPLLARSFFEKAFEQFKTQENVAGIFLSWSGVIESITSGFEDFKPLDQWISVFEELMQHFKGFPSQEIALRAATNMFMALLYRQPHHPEIEEWTEQAFSLAEASSDIGQKLRTLNRLAQYLMFMGDFQRTRLAMNSSQQLAQSRDAPPIALILAKYIEATYYSQIRLHEKSLKSVFDGLELARTTGMHLSDFALLGAGVSSALMANDPPIAGKLLEEMASRLREQKPWMTCFYHLLRTQEALLRENPEDALLHADMSLKLSMDVGSPLSSLYCHLAKAHVMNNLKKEKETIKHLTAAANIARQIKSNIFQFWILLAQSLFAFNPNQEASALTSLQEALSLGREGGYLNTFIYQSSTMVRLCEKALEAGIEVEYVQHLIRKRHLTPEKPPFHLENWPWPIKIVTLGRFELFKDGKPIQFSRKAQQKPLSMLKALIAYGGKEVREEQLGDALWPDADGDAAHHSFEMTLHRLRKLIGYENAIQYREGRVTLDPGYCWVDVWAFERILGGVDGKQREGLIETAVLSTQKAVKLYRGPFLAGEVEQGWMVSIRERLRRKFLRNVSWLGHYWEQSQNYDRALECYERGLEVDDLAEELYRHLIMCYQRLGRQAEALSVYRRCKRTLSASLGIEPSSETEAIYRTILTQKR